MFSGLLSMRKRLLTDSSIAREAYCEWGSSGKLCPSRWERSAWKLLPALDTSCALRVVFLVPCSKRRDRVSACNWRLCGTGSVPYWFCSSGSSSFRSLFNVFHWPPLRLIWNLYNMNATAQVNTMTVLVWIWEAMAYHVQVCYSIPVDRCWSCMKASLNNALEHSVTRKVPLRVDWNLQVFFNLLEQRGKFRHCWYWPRTPSFSVTENRTLCLITV